MKSLRSVLNKLCKQFEDGGRDLGIIVPNLHGPMQDGGVSRIDPIEEHHVGDFGVESESNAAEISGQSDDRLADLLRIATGRSVEKHGTQRLERLGQRHEISPRLRQDPPSGAGLKMCRTLTGISSP